MRHYEVIVVGAGHAGCEAAIASARLGSKTLLITTNMEKVATLPCNPSIGGPGKGHIVREIGVLGGVMARIADASAIQIKELNTSKGPAVRAYRAQIEQETYNRLMREELEQTVNLEFYQDEVKQVLAEDQQVQGVLTGDGTKFGAQCVVICTGTFMTGQIIIGDRVVRDGGRMDEHASNGLTGSLNALGLKHGRLKTGTPPRIARDSIDYEAMEPAPGTEGTISFSYPTRELMSFESQVPCYLTYTNPKTHKIILDNLSQTPIFNGMITERAPRSCPSLDRKVVNFPDRDRHPIFIEPTGRDNERMYIQGGSLAFPEELQEEIIHSIKGLEQARFLAYGYSVVYDFFHPHQLHMSLETKAVSGLYLAGQINGTTGYEEAAAQGLIAGINAARQAQSLEPVILRRDQAYIGVLIDDLVTKIHVEPYRMFTSRAEYRLLLRNDNADLRLAEIGHDIGLVSDDFLAYVKAKREALNTLVAQFKNTKVNVHDKVFNAYHYLTQPHTTIADLPIAAVGADHSQEVLDLAEIDIKYHGYFEKQARLADKLREHEELPIVEHINYHEIKGLRNEAVVRLEEVNPETVGQASRVQGITPADISLLLVANRKFATTRAS